jgi:hypothetical protein
MDNEQRTKDLAAEGASGLEHGGTSIHESRSITYRGSIAAV